MALGPWPQTLRWEHVQFPKTHPADCRSKGVAAPLCLLRPRGLLIRCLRPWWAQTMQYHCNTWDWHHNATNYTDGFLKKG